MFAMRLDPDMESHLQYASAARGLTRSEYVRTALAVALNADPVTVDIARKLDAIGNHQDRQPVAA